ncbi:TonB-dependent receptor domain-containing protein [Sphingomonas bacterium]|uniref:TonB-dependent receptor domain-containing protein n=1 Tax=Sphingomonas bacterium TaxID=1895847 RepID=UPI0020C61EC2|nr:TonB-dependent receptor [Sphingomonas bacterium]
MIKTIGFARKSLAIGVSSAALLVGLASPAFAQTAQAGDTTAPQTAPGSKQADAANDGSQQIQAQRDNTDQGQNNDGGNDVIVTGSLLRRTSTETPSPVTVLTSDTLLKEGINNVSDAIRSVSADGAGSISTGFQNGFSAGGSAVSLRGLGVSSTLILIDGQRSTQFPLNDDGHNAYTDLNSIPFSIVDRVEVLKDGASSAYGSDAIGGVVNVILKKHITGIAGAVEGGISERGDAGQQRANLTIGYGDYDTQGFNVYVNGEYQHNNALADKDRDFPYNTTDLLRTGGLDNNAADSSLSTATTNAVVRRTTQIDPNNPLSGGGAGTTTGQYVTLNLGNCQRGTYTVAGAAGGVGCQHDNTYDYTQILPEQTRYSANARASFKLGSDIEGYIEGIYAHDDVVTPGTPRSTRVTQPFGGSPNLAANNPGLALPVYVCAAGVNCGTAADRRLNPNNPFAALGSSARLYYLFGDIPQYTVRRNDLYRVSGGLNGSLGNGYNFTVEGVYAKDNFSLSNHGNLNISNLLNAINTGAYNFVDPTQNSAAVRSFVSPNYTTPSYSAEASVDASISKSFFQLPGGDLQLLVGAQVRRENENNRSNNPVGTVTVPGGATYISPLYYTANTSSAFGRHTVSSGFFEIDAPIFKQLEVNGSGRYDSYSEGFNHFSPKIGVKFTPIPQVAIRGTYSEGFRAPTFAENGPTSAYAGFSNFTPPQSFQLAHGGLINGTPATATSAAIPPNTNPYTQLYSLGSATVGNPNLKPETSRSFTAGVVIQPVRWLSITADYYNIRKNNYIQSGPDVGAARTAYFAGTPLPAGYTVNTVDAPDPLFPNALPRVLIINVPFVNAGRQETSGVDVSATANFPITQNIKFISRVEVTDVFNLDLIETNGVRQRYVGTLGPYELSSGAGTPRIRGNWQNTIEAGPVSLTATVFYVSRIKEVAADEAAVDPTADVLSCGGSQGGNNQYGTGNNFCYIHSFIDTDLNTAIRVNDKFTFTFNVSNLLDVKAPLAPASYSGTNYLPTWHLDGVIGRAFRAGANFKF